MGCSSRRQPRDRYRCCSSCPSASGLHRIRQDRTARYAAPMKTALARWSAPSQRRRLVLLIAQSAQRSAGMTGGGGAAAASSAAHRQPVVDKEKLESTVQLCAIRVAKTETQDVVKKLRQVLFRGRRIAPVVDDPASGEHK